MTKGYWIFLFIFLLLILAVGTQRIEILQRVKTFDQAQISTWIDGAGIWGPILLVALMATAIVASPIPSAPIAIAAGAACGHVTGTFIIVVGAELGAIVAFGIARWLGRSAVEKYLGSHIESGLLGSQNALTFTVFATRLMPFVSFDIISYAAGLSRLHFWRFGLATLAGIIPASFFLAHFGGVAAGAQGGSVAWLALGLGLVTALPLFIAVLRKSSGS